MKLKLNKAQNNYTTKKKLGIKLKNKA